MGRRFINGRSSKSRSRRVGGHWRLRSVQEGGGGSTCYVFRVFDTKTNQKTTRTIRIRQKYDRNTRNGVLVIALITGHGIRTRLSSSDSGYRPPLPSCRDTGHYGRKRATSKGRRVRRRKRHAPESRFKRLRVIPININLDGIRPSRVGP